MNNETIKILRFKLETNMFDAKDQYNIDAKYNLPSIHRGEKIPDSSSIEHRKISDCVRMMLHNNDIFLIDIQDVDILSEYFIDAEKPSKIATIKNINIKEVNQKILRIKKRAIKLLKKDIKKSERKRYNEFCIKKRNIEKSEQKRYNEKCIKN